VARLRYRVTITPKREPAGVVSRVANSLQNRSTKWEARCSSNSARDSDRVSTRASIGRRCERSMMQSSRAHPRDYTTTAARTTSSDVASMYILHPVADDEILPAFLPTQPIRSSGIFCTEYSRCSDAIMQTVRFFDIISSSLSRRLPSHAEYHRSSQSQIRGLSAARTNRMEHGTKQDKVAREGQERGTLEGDARDLIFVGFLYSLELRSEYVYAIFFSFSFLFIWMVMQGVFFRAVSR